MSERGSLITEYIYCMNCYKAIKKVLDDSPLTEYRANFAYNKMVVVTDYCAQFDDDGELPILAYKISESFSGGELVRFSSEVAPEIGKVICHPVRVAVMAEDRPEVYLVTPGDGIIDGMFCLLEDQLREATNANEETQIQLHSENEAD